jgi:hypothetical protein
LQQRKVGFSEAQVLQDDLAGARVPLGEVGYGHLEARSSHLLGDGETGLFIHFLLFGEVVVFGG